MIAPDGFHRPHHRRLHQHRCRVQSQCIEGGRHWSINVDRALQFPWTSLIFGQRLLPNSVHAIVNQVVRFTNNGTENHTATGDDLSWGTGNHSTGVGHVQPALQGAGTFTFFDRY